MNKYKDIVCSTQWRSKKWSKYHKQTSKCIYFKVGSISFYRIFFFNQFWTIIVVKSIYLVHSYTFKSMSFESVKIYQTHSSIWPNWSFFWLCHYKGIFCGWKLSTDLQFLSSSLYPKSLNRSGNGENTREKKLKNVDLRQLSLWGNSM